MKKKSKLFIYIVCAIAFIGLSLAFIAHYGKYGFNWKCELCLLPVYLVCGYGIYGCYKMLTNIFEFFVEEN